MRNSRFISIILTAVSLFVCIVLLTSCAGYEANNPEPVTAATAWSTPTQVSAAQPNSIGAMVRANVHGTGVFVTQGVRQLGGLRWKVKAGQAGGNTDLVVHGSTVYYGEDGRIHAVDAATGTEKWQREIDNTDSSAPAVAEGVVYVGTWERFFALSADSGDVKWVFEPERGSDDRAYIDPVVAGGVVYFGSWHSLYALDSQTGLKLWRFEVSGLITRVPIVYDQTVYISTYSPQDHEVTYLYAIDSRNGTEKWKLPASGGDYNGALAVTGGVLYSSTDDGLIALEAASGQEKWRFRKGSIISTSPAVAYNSVFVMDAGTLYAVDAQTGNELWQLNSVGGILTDVVIADGTIYFGSFSSPNIFETLNPQTKGALHAVNAQSGRELWKYEVDGGVRKAPVISDGTVYLVSEAGTLYAVK